jgi:hypothetical protein
MQVRNTEASLGGVFCQRPGGGFRHRLHGYRVRGDFFAGAFNRQRFDAPGTSLERACGARFAFGAAQRFNWRALVINRALVADGTGRASWRSAATLSLMITQKKFDLTTYA